MSKPIAEDGTTPMTEDTPAQLWSKLQLAVQHSGQHLHIKVPTHVLRRLVDSMNMARIDAEIWLATHEPTPDIQNCTCGGGIMCPIHEAAAVIRQLAFLPALPVAYFTDQEEETNGTPRVT